MYDYNSFWIFLFIFIGGIMLSSIVVNWVFKRFLQQEEEQKI